MYRAAVIDDEKLDSEKIAACVGDWAGQKGVRVQVTAFPSAEAFLFAYEEDKAWDLLLLDVEMREMSGIELAKKLRKGGLRAALIFITSHFEFWGEGYEVDALHYLTKPVAAEKLFPVLDRAWERGQEEPPAVVISCEGETVKLLLDEILYVESFSHYICIHTPEREYKIKESISAFEEKLGAGFFRVHRSYLASLKKIVRISRRSVTLDGGAELPLARGNYDSVSRAYIEFC